MKSLGLSHLLGILTCILLLTPSISKDDRKIYIVYMGEYPKDMKIKESSHTSMVQSVLGSKFASDTLLHSYKSFNGFVVRLTKEDLKTMKGMDGVVSVIPNRVYNVQTTRSWNFLNFPENVRRTQVEGDTIVGVIDSGIWIDSDSFTDRGFGPPPQRWNGACQDFICNKKVIGAKYFRNGGNFDPEDIISPTDTTGHGSHCASIAAGNLVPNANLYGLGLGTARGGVPSARIAVYKVCWKRGCETIDILAGFDDAILDGVDFLSVSVGLNENLPYFEDAIAIGAFHAMRRGILTSNSAGNSGPNFYTMTNAAPWYISVAATTIDRKFFTNLTLGSGHIINGVSVNTFTPPHNGYPLVFGGDVPAPGFNGSISRFCIPISWNENLVRGKIVLCEGSPPSEVRLGLASGAAGLGHGYGFAGAIRSDNLPLVVADIFPFPAIHISKSDGFFVDNYIRSTRNPEAIISKSFEEKDPRAPYIAPFSSRGPNRITLDILKPDIAAPGVNILASWSQLASISGDKIDTRKPNYNIQSGTSMACPHVTAAAVYVKSFHPDWPPAVLKSALMTTATPLNPEAEFAYGAGQVNPLEALNPGIVYDAGPNDYINFLCGQPGYSTKLLQRITGDNNICTSENAGSVFNLNLPSFALSTAPSKYNDVIFRRNVTNVGSATSIYNATVTGYPHPLKIEVVPNVLNFTHVGQRLSFIVRIQGTINTNLASYSLTWKDGTHQARSPIVVYVP